MILHGTEDAVVPMAQSEKLYNTLQKAGIPCEIAVVEGAAHGDDLFYQDEMTDLVLSFLDRLSGN